MTLAIKVNQPYLEEAARLMEVMDFETGINWPACWQELLDVFKQPVNSYCQDEPEVSTQLPDVMDTQAQLPRPDITTLDSRTNYEQQPVASYCQSEPEVSTQLTDAMDTQAQLPQPYITTLDSRTNYEQLPVPYMSCTKVFQTLDHDPRMT
ncbi:hypothetical protein, partial [Sansalvadorimonas verongulae]|uniref:hypothetical protein n=1 Tax=Sansalvadorimonas verongulae TaxID=2172824 RepID=UPI0012BC40A3